MAKLAALVPAPRVHLARYNGVLAPAAKWRAAIVPTPVDPDVPSSVPASPSIDENMTASTEPDLTLAGKSPRRNYSWALLMMRVFQVDVLECENCGGRLRILAAIHPPDTTRKILDCLGLPSRAPPLGRAVLEASSDSF